MTVLFMGTPQFAVPSLETLLEKGHTVCGVFTQPDRPKNRGMKVLSTPVKEFSLAHDLPVFQPEKLRDGAALELIKALAPALIVVAAYGRLLPPEILAVPKLGCINVHSSLLPKYRGAAPINWAILNGEGKTGVTIMHMAAELDAGDIIAQKETEIGPDENAGELTLRLADLGAALLGEVLDRMAAGELARTPQAQEQATFAPMLTRELSALDWSKPAAALHNQVRGLLPWPAATATLGGVRCKVLSSRVREGAGGAPGELVMAGEEGIRISCGDGRSLEILELQADGGKRMTAGDYLRGHPLGLQ